MAEYDWIEGRQPVLEFLKAGQAVNKLLVVKDSRDRQMQRIVALAKEKGIIIQEVDRRYLDKISATGRHQGVAAQIAAVEYAELEELISKPQDLAWPPSPGIGRLQDPTTRLLRSAEAAKVGGNHPKRRAVGNTSSGKGFRVPQLCACCWVVNIPRAIDDLRGRLLDCRSGYGRGLL